MNTLFTFELLIVAVMVAVIVGGALYITMTNRRRRRETGREVGSAGIPVGVGPEGPDEATGRSVPHVPHREFYKRMSLENDEDMKMHLYSLDEYAGDLGGDVTAFGGERFIGAIKAYRPVGDEWYDFPPDRAADVLDLAPEEYEIDRERGVLLLRRLPRGLPSEARDVL